MGNIEIVGLSRLKRRLALGLSAVALLLAAGGAFLHLSSRATLRAGAESLLLSTNHVKMDQLLGWRQDRLSNTMSLLDSPVLSVHIRRYAADPSDKATAALLRQRLNAYLLYNKYVFAAFTDRSGNTLISAGQGTAERACPNFGRLASLARASGLPQMGDFYLPPGERSPHIDIVTLAADARAGRELFLLLRVDPAEFLYPLLKTWTAEGRTGEVLLISRDGESVLFLNDLRHVNDAAMRLRLPLSSESLPAAMAVKGYSGLVRGRDYRGVEVLAAVGPVAGTSWAMVTKLDWDEVMQGTGALGALVALLVLALIAVSSAGAYLMFVRQAAAYERIKSNYDLFSEKANDGILVVDMATRTVLEANPKACEMYGYPPERMKGLRAEAVIPPGDREAFKERIAQTMRAGGRAYEVNHLRADGTVFPAEISSSIVDVSGKTTMFVIVRDVTERKRARELLARLTDQVPGVVYQYRLYPDGRSCFPYASSGMEMIYEVTPDEVREDATPVFGRLHPDDLKGTAEAIAASARDLSIFHWEFRVVLPRQGPRWRLCDARPERLPEGGTLWHGIITDITDRKRAEAERSLGERRTASLLKLSSYRGGDKDLLDLALEEALKVTGSSIGYIYRYSEETRKFVLNTWSREVMPECLVRNPQTEYDLEATGIWGEVVRQRKPIIVNDYAAPDPLKKGCPKGHVPLKNWMSVPVFSGGKIVGAVGMANKEGPYDEADVRQLTLMMDGVWRIMAQAASERQRDGFNVRLQAKNEELENFLYITTHDLRTPLVNIQGFTQNVSSYFSEIGKLLGAGAGGAERVKKLTDEKIPEALSFVREGSQKMEALIAALLKVSRAGRVELKPEKTELEPLLSKIKDAMRFQVEAAGAEITVSPGLPACYADPGAVSQIFSNLLDNAVKYRDPARPLRVLVTAEAKDNLVVYSVADNGRGISVRELGNIWAVFARPVSTRQRGEGIGLPMVKRIAERSGGAITAESKEGDGSVFRVELPAA